ncbi:hypothetical protein SAY86_019380 [Trapa natans]|uniref:PAS domain-containing protein n=1 Tax=Trapa natans TaxID=22666 RepID=A0AAN7M0B5_TRANT|nr:hypothetical protein SAY86_019380 [Trapa natans]
MAGVGDAPSESQYQVLVDRCRTLEDNQAELRRQLDEMLSGKEKTEEDAAEGFLLGGAYLPGFFPGGIPYRRMLESIGHAVHVCSPSTGEIVYWNPTAESLYGWKKHEAIGKRMNRLIVSEEDDIHLQNILKRLNFEQSWSGQFPFKRKTGEIFMAMTTKSLLYEDGEVVGIITVSSDATHFSSINLEHQQHSQGSGSPPPREPIINFKRIQWNPRPQIVGIHQIASSVSNLASKAMSHRTTDRNDNECAASRCDGTCNEDDLMKKPAKLALKLLEKLHIGKNRGRILEHDESSQQDSSGDVPRSSPLLNIPGMSRTSISSEGVACAEGRQGNLAENEFSVPVAMKQSFIQQKNEKYCSQCFNMPKPEDLQAKLVSEVSEKMGGKIVLFKDRGVTDKAQGEHEERNSPSLSGIIDSTGSASSRGDTELSSIGGCKIDWEDLQIGEEIGQGILVACLCLFL